MPGRQASRSCPPPFLAHPAEGMRMKSCLSLSPQTPTKGHLGGGGGETPTEVGGCFFWEFPAQKSALFVFRFSQDAPPQMTQRTSWLCLCVVGQEIPEVSYPTDSPSGYKGQLWDWPAQQVRLERRCQLLERPGEHQKRPFQHPRPCQEAGRVQLSTKRAPQTRLFDVQERPETRRAPWGLHADKQAII
jgi:hypothetical protein